MDYKLLLFLKVIDHDFLGNSLNFIKSCLGKQKFLDAKDSLIRDWPQGCHQIPSNKREIYIHYLTSSTNNNVYK